MEVCLLRYVPDYILHQMSTHPWHGHFAGFVLLLDIEDFTGRVEELQGEGQQGADRVGELLNEILAGPIEAIHRHQGFVNFFSGDAVCAIFAHQQPEHLRSALQDIRSCIASLNGFYRKTKRQAVSLREAVSFGKIVWAIFRTDFQYEYLFSGQPFIDVNALIAHPSGKVYSAAAQAVIEQDQQQSVASCPPTAKVQCVLNVELAEVRRALFLHRRWHNLSPANEIRSLATCFVNLDLSIDISRAVKQVHHLADRYHGYVNKIEYTQKGIRGLIIFGAPLSDGRSLVQAGDFALAVVKASPTSSIGMSCGFAYAGYIGATGLREYTGLGHPMNIAARLMNRAKSGEVLCDNIVWLDLHESYELEALDDILLKGVGKAIPCYSLLRRNIKTRIFFRYPFVGRKTELETLNQSIDEAIEQEQNLIIYISGEPGLGKSRLAFEAMKSFQQHRQIAIYCQQDSPLAGAAIKEMIKALLSLSSSLTLQELKTQLKLSYARIFDGRKTERPELSTLASLLDIDYAASLWDGIESAMRAEKQAEAFGQFLRYFVRHEPLLMILDDAQWLDAQSLAFLQNISLDDSRGLVILAPCRTDAEGHRLQLPLPQLRHVQMGLEKLCKADAYSLLKEILQVSQIAAASLELIYSRSAGNPFFLEQISMYLKESGLINDHTKLSQAITELPYFSISDVINSRIDGFTKNMQELLCSASVLGMQFNVKVLTQMLNQSIEANLQAGLQHRLWTQLSELQYIFSHVLLRDVIYHRMVSEKVTALHRLASQTLINIYGEDNNVYAAEIAHHYEKAEYFEAAVSYFRKASIYNMKANTWQEAISTQRKAVILSGQYHGFGTDEHIEQLFWMGLYHHYIQHYNKAEPIYHRVMKCRIERLGEDSPQLSAYLNNLGRFYKDTGRYTEAKTLLRKSLRIEHMQHPRSANVADRLNNLASLYARMSIWPKAMNYLRLSLKVFQECNHVDKLSFTALLHNNIARIYIKMNELEAAESYCLQALSTLAGTVSENDPKIAHCHLNLYEIRLQLQQYDLAQSALDTAMQKYRSFFGETNPEYARCLIYQGDLYCIALQPTAAQTIWQEALAILKQTISADHPLMQELKTRLASISA